MAVLRGLTNSCGKKRCEKKEKKEKRRRKKKKAKEKKKDIGCNVQKNSKGR